MMCDILTTIMLEVHLEDVDHFLYVDILTVGHLVYHMCPWL